MSIRKLGLAATIAFLVALAGGSSSAKTVTLTFAHWYAESEARGFINDSVAAFERANSGVHIKQWVVDYQFYSEKLLVAGSAGVIPDIIMFSGDHVSDLSKVMVPLNAYLAKSPLRTDIPYVGMWRSCTVQGRVYGVPMGGGVSRATWYNPDAFARVGLKPPQGVLRWDYLKSVSPKLALDTNGDGKNERAAFEGSIGTFMEPWVIANGANYINDDAKSVGWDGPLAIDAMQFYWNWAIRDKNILLATQTPFEVQKAAMMSAGPWMAGHFRKLKLPVELTHFPQNTPVPRSSANVDALGIGAAAGQRRTLALKFLEFMLSPEVQGSYAARTGFPAMNVKALETAVYKRAVSAEPTLGMANELMKSACPLPPARRRAEVTKLGIAMHDVFVRGDRSIQAVAQRFAKEANVILSSR